MHVSFVYVVIELSKSCLGCCYASESPHLQERTVDIGGNLTLPCTDSDTLPPEDASGVMWVRDGREQINRKRIQPDGGLSLTVVDREDAGIYSCRVDSNSDSSVEYMDVRTRVKVEVRSEYIIYNFIKNIFQLSVIYCSKIHII